VKYNRAWVEIISIYDKVAPYFLKDVPALPKDIDESSAQKIFDMIYPNENILLEFTDSNMKLSNKAKVLYELIPHLEGAYWNQISKILNQWAESLERNLNKMAPNLNMHIQQLFGVDLPSDFLVMLSYGKEKDFLKGSQISDAPLINLEIAEDRGFNAHLDIVLHEILHYLIKTQGLHAKFKKAGKSRMFEEAFVKFLVPRGILSKRMGIAEFNIEKIKDNRCDKEIDFLRPYMLEYYSNNPSETIFQFLERKKVL
jgi:hypothetical protein